MLPLLLEGKSNQLCSRKRVAVLVYQQFRMKLNNTLGACKTSVCTRLLHLFIFLLWGYSMQSCKALPTGPTENPVTEEKKPANAFSFDELEAENTTFEEQIFTVHCHPVGQPTLPPIVPLGGNGVTLSFDDMSTEQRTFYYTVLHCDAYWNFSDLDPVDYIRGFNENTIDEVAYSFNTMADYVHYQVDFPDEMMQTRLSGNYIIYVYEDGDKDLPVLTQRFIVYETLVAVGAVAGAPRTISKIRTSQELTLSVNYESFSIPNPYDDVVVSAIQNGRWDNALYIDAPTFVRNNQIIYDNAEATTFLGSNEWRNMDLKDMRYRSPEIANIQPGDSHWQVTLHPDKNRAYTNHQTLFDLNGGFVIINDQGDNGEIDSDYVNVFFTLPMDHALISEEVYVFGALSNWQKQERFKMSYNIEKQRYEGSALVKQGYYDYMYAVYDPHGSTADLQRLEGSHRAPMNDYSVLVYHRDMLLNYDRIVGHSKAVSQ